MKKEVLRINNLTVKLNISHLIENVSLTLLEGEITSLAGLNDSGKDFMITLLRGTVKQAVQNLSVNSLPIADLCQLNAYVYNMSKATFAFENWTVSEFIGLVDYNARLWTLSAHRFNDDMQNYLTSIGVEIDVRRQLKELTDTEQKVLGIAKAIRLGKPLIILQDEFEDYSAADLGQLKTTIKKIIRNKAALLVNTQSNLALQRLSDQLCFFQDGTIIKKFRNSSDEHLTHLLSNDSSQKIFPESHRESAHPDTVIESSFILRNVVFNQESRVFQLKKGELSLVIISDYKKRLAAFEALSGRVFAPPITLESNSESCQLLCYSDYIKHGVVSIKYEPTELLRKMTAADNLLIPSIRKLNSTQYIRWSKRLKRLIPDSLHDQSEFPAKDLTFHEQLILYYERWLIYKPKLLILLDPFRQCDTNDIALVNDYINKYLNIGTHVIVIQSHMNNLEHFQMELLQNR